MARSHVIVNWDPEDTVAWAAGNDKIARRNLIWSTVAEHVGFSIWSIWSVMVLFMPESVYGFSAGDKFLLAAAATLAGGGLRIPYSLATAAFGGRNWTVFSALALLIPTVAMTNINAFYPNRLKGWALAVNAGGSAQRCTWITSTATRST